MIVELPAPTTLMVLPVIVATLGLEEVNDQGAGELVVGGTSGMLPTPYVAVIIGNEPRIVNVACAVAGNPPANNEIVTAYSAIRRNFFDLYRE